MALAPTALAPVSLDDKYTLEEGRIYVTGTQALVRLPMLQRARDLAAGLNTGSFISGYRGSPLGGVDMAFWGAKKFLARNPIHFQPGVNEDLAATAVWGSQQLAYSPGARYDGVVGIWYGKGPGVDRSGDPIKHGNFAGTAPHGGVLALAGDDHACKSSTLPHQSEFAFVHYLMPVLNPASVQEYLDLGLAGIAMSRFSGCWVAFKCITETVDSTASVTIDPSRVSLVTPGDFDLPPGGLSIRWPDAPVEAERRLIDYKLPAVQAFARANGIDRVVLGGPQRRIGIIAAGKAYLDVRQALEDLGISEQTAIEIGLSIYKPALVWPMEPQALRAFAEGLDEILVVEEKRNLIEDQVRAQLYNWPADKRPRIVGKTEEDGQMLLSSSYELAPIAIAGAIVKRLKKAGVPFELSNRLAFLESREALRANKQSVERTPYFCSGCPHNTSTNVPEGSRAVAGIGCHTMAISMNRSTSFISQMGGEGVFRVGQQPFTDEKHIFSNLGDGTYFHSGLLAIRQAVAAKANITYKILFNDAVAMTGGQKVDGELTVPQVAHQVWAEGIERLVVVSDEPERYAGFGSFPPYTTIHHRDDLDTIQRELREVPGVTVMIYDQTCAAEKRRRRKRKLMVDPPKRAFINELVCEGCGDCSKTSNCVSVTPIETEFGRKRAIDQSSCNKDLSCIKGFCPSFVTVHGGQLKRPQVQAKGPAGDGATFPDIPEPVLPALDRPYGMMVTGIGGTGVVTIGALLGMAAHIEGKGCTILDQTGLAQKGGAVMSHIRLAPTPDHINAVRLGAGSTDVVIGCDMVVSASGEAISKMAPETTRAVINTKETITGAFTQNPEFRIPGQEMIDRIADACGGADRVSALNATEMATALMGDSIATNLFVLGYAYQKGLVPISAAAIEAAIELNGVAIAMNRQAFLWGRRAAHDEAAVRAIATPAEKSAGDVVDLDTFRKPAETLADMVDRRVTFLTGYQNRAYAERYRELVATVAATEQEKVPGSEALAKAVARYLFKLMAYKDEYEVARLYTDGSFKKAIEAQFEGDYKLQFHLAPPALNNRDPATGRLKKQAFGPWMLRVFGLLARFKHLRGTSWDPFGHTEERKMERRLIDEYRRVLSELTAKLTAENLDLAVEIASVPEQIRGYGHVKERNVEEAKAREADLLARFRDPAAPRAAAE